MDGISNFLVVPDVPQAVLCVFRISRLPVQITCGCLLCLTARRLKVHGAWICACSPCPPGIPHCDINCYRLHPKCSADHLILSVESFHVDSSLMLYLAWYNHACALLLPIFVFIVDPDCGDKVYLMVAEENKGAVHVLN